MRRGGIELSDRFTFTESHAKLLQRAYIGWQSCETGAPEIDPKRPYGNSSVALDVAEILEIPPHAACRKCGEACERCDDEGSGYTREQREMLMRVHRETEFALQIVLQHGYRCGVYERAGRGWSYQGQPEG
jgi:hypothetical protein